MQWRWPIPLSALLVLFVFTSLEAQAPGSQSEVNLPLEALHQVQAKDNLHLLAAYYYGDARQWVRIFETNRNAIQDPSVIHPGQVLRFFLSPDWTPAEPYNQWKSRVWRVFPFLRVPPSQVPEQTSALPSQNGLFTLRYHGTKGLVELADVAVRGNVVYREGAKTREHSLALVGLLESRIDDITPEGYFDVTLRTVDLRSQGPPVPPALLDPASLGLPPMGEGIRVRIDNRFQIIKVLHGDPQLAAEVLAVTYPERALSIGDSWEETYTVRTNAASPFLVKTAFVLKSRERFQDQEVVRVDYKVQGKGEIPERKVAFTHRGSGIMYISRASGSPIYQNANVIMEFDNSATGATDTVTVSIQITNRP